MINFNIFISPFLILFVGLFFFNEGIELDIENNRYRNYKFFIFKFGKWKKMPLINNIKVSGIMEQRKFYGSSTSSVRVSEKVYEVNLFYTFKNKEKKITFCREKNIENAKQIADLIQQKIIKKSID